MKKATVLIAASIFIFSPFAFCAQGTAAAPDSKPARVSFATSDGWTLYADYAPAKPGLPTVLMVHGLGSSRGEWLPLETRLAERGAGYLSVDMRCHGESVTDPSGNPMSNWMACLQNVKDVEAAWNFLVSKKVAADGIYAAGASIGANLVLNAKAAGLIRPAGLVLLSPGLDYRGITTGKAIEKIGRLPVLLAAALTDEYSLKTVRILNKTALAGGNIPEVITAGTGHGVNMFLSENPDADTVLDATGKFIFNDAGPAGRSKRKKPAAKKVSDPDSAQ
ncbi:MAG: alpha/beta hydrolase [Elusimicrobiaceae bacterium]|nr:alpha/beta hydrolase [Elusimicrobiaceae bacterium]